MKRRIAILLPDLRGGGVEHMRLKLAAEFARRGFEPEFWLLQSKGELLSKAVSYPVIDLGAPRLRNALLPLIRTWLSRKPDALLIAMWPLTVLGGICSLILRVRGIRTRLLFSDHNTLSLKPEARGWLRRQILRWSVRMFYPMADIRVCVSSGVADDLAAISGLRREEFQVIHNPAFDESATDSDALDPWPPCSLRILTVGSMKEQKHQSLAIEALSKLDRPDTFLAILGDGALRPELRELAVRLGISNRVLMPGFVANPAPWYKHASVFVLTSRWEGFANVIVEAMQHGVQVVSTDCKSGPAEILENGRLGRLIPVGDVNALVEAIHQSQTAPVDITVLKARAGDFSIDQIAARYLTLLFPDE